MSQPLQIHQIIHNAYPCLSEQEVREAAKNKEICSVAEMLVSKNAYSHRVILGMQGVGFSSFILEDYSDDIPLKINPFYRISSASEKVSYLTWGDVCIALEGYQDLVDSLQPVSRYILPFKLQTIFNPEQVSSKIQKDIFASSDKVPSYQKKDAQDQKKGLDSFLSQMGQLFGTKTVWQEIFNDMPVPLTHVEDEYPFQKNKDPQTIMDVCLENKLPDTAIRLIDETYTATHDYNAVVRLLKGATTFNLFKKNVRFNRSQQPHNAVTQVMEHLEKLLPANLYLTQVAGYRIWNSDYQRGELQL